MSVIRLSSLDEVAGALAAHPRLLVFKHSPICPVSARALMEWERFVMAHPEAALGFVDVVGDRPVARGLAESSGVRHESPQAILFADGIAIWDESHGGITEDSLTTAWNG